jgi:hypothetical protein
VQYWQQSVKLASCEITALPHRFIAIHIAIHHESLRPPFRGGRGAFRMEDRVNAMQISVRAPLQISLQISSQASLKLSS